MERRRRGRPNCMKMVSIGEVLWDVFPSGERLGGAPFNFSAHAARLGHRVSFVSGAGRDERGLRAIEEMTRLGVDTRFVASVAGAPTGFVTVQLEAGEPSYTIYRPAAYDFPSLDGSQFEALLESRPEWIYYGTLAQSSAAVRSVTRRIVDGLPAAQRFYDVNLRPSNDDPALVGELLASATFVKLNEDETTRLALAFSLPASPVEAFARALCLRFGCAGACVTLGVRGCAILYHGAFVECAGYPVRVQDAVGAGDAFSAALLHGLALDQPLAGTGDFANRVGALVASKSGAIPAWTLAEAQAL